MRCPHGDLQPLECYPSTLATHIQNQTLSQSCRYLATVTVIAPSLQQCTQESTNKALHKQTSNRTCTEGYRNPHICRHHHHASCCTCQCLLLLFPFVLKCGTADTANTVKRIRAPNRLHRLWSYACNINLTKQRKSCTPPLPTKFPSTCCRESACQA